MTPEAQNKLTRVYTEDDAQAIGLPTAASLSLLKNFANEMKDSPFMPVGLQGHPGTLMAVMLRGREMGLKPMESLDAFWLSPQKRLALYSNWMLVIMRRNGIKLTFKRCDNDGCEIHGRRPDGDEYTATWDVADTKRAGIGGQHTKYPRAMNRARAIGDLFRALASDYGGGNLYTPEEVADIEGDSSASDQARADQITHGGNEEFVVARKPKAAEPEPEKAEPAPVVVEVKAEPIAHAVAPEPVAKAAEPAPEPAPAPATTDQKPAAPTAKDLYLAEFNKAKDLLLEAKMNPTKADKAIKDFLLGFFGVSKMSACNIDEILNVGFPSLHASLAISLTAFMNDPSGAGRIAKHSGGVLEEALRGYSWSDKTIELAKDCMTHYGLTPEDYLKYVDMNGLKALSDADAYQYFRVSRVSRDAYLLMEISDEFKISVSQLVADLEKVHGKPIGELDSKTVTSGVRLAQAMMREEKNRQSGDAASNDANDDTDELPFG